MTNEYHEAQGIPAAAETERALMGLALQHPIDVMDAITEGIGDGAFHNPSTRRVYDAMQAMAKAEHTIDSVTVNQWLTERGGMDEDTHRNLVLEMMEWTEKALGLSMVPQYIAILRDKKLRRDALIAAETIQRLAYEPDKPAAEIMNEAQACLFEVQAAENAGLKPIAPAVKNTIEEIQHAYRNRGKVTKGLTTGFIELDRMLMGLEPGSLTYIAARPSMGKTALAMNIVEHIAVDRGVPVDVFSLEMSTNQLVTRLVCAYSGINLQRVRDGFFDKQYSQRLLRGSGDLARSQIEIDETPQITIAELRARARRSKLKRNTGLIVIDYLQLMKGVSRQAQNSREREIAEISAGLKAMAKELNVPVICLAQLNRDVDQRKDKRPALSDLRESGSIEQDADTIVFLTRRYQYTHEEEDINQATIIVGKNRNGPTGDFELVFQGEFTRFKNPEHQQALYGANSHNTQENT